MIGGYWSKLLRVDLTTKKVSVENLSEEFLQKYLGGSGLGTKLLYDEVSPGIDPLSPQNKIIFANGPFQGTNVPGSGKWSVVSKSPLTNTFAVSTAGAEWGDRFKRTGFDALCIEGSSDTPVYLSIIDEEIRIEDASAFWGLDAVKTTEKLKEELPKNTSVATIGQAGEKKVAIACIVADSHSFAGRCGLGAVMGSKNLKAIAVKGNKQVPIFNKERVKELTTDTFKLLRDNTKETFTKYGTSVLVTSSEAVGDLPIKYWSGDVWTEEAPKIGAPYYSEKLNAKPWPCKSCPIGCHRKVNLTLQSGENIDGAGAEYESLGMLGSCCLVSDLEAISKANDICNRLGIDTISAGSYVGFTMECFEKGYINEEKIGYRALWGDPEVLVRLVSEIGEKQGFGALFDKGIVSAAKEIGKEAEDIAVHVKGLDLPAHDPRSYYSLAINYATSTRGACHLRGFPHVGESGLTIPEVGINESPQQFSLDGQAYLTIVFQDLSTVLDSLVCCLFMQCSGMDLTKTTEFLNAITGWDLRPQELVEIGERAFNLQRIINVKDGYSRETDKLPKRMFEPALKGFRANKAPFGLKDSLDEYYKLRGWDENGLPTENKMISLKLVD